MQVQYWASGEWIVDIYTAVKPFKLPCMLMCKDIQDSLSASPTRSTVSLGLNLLQYFHKNKYYDGKRQQANTRFMIIHSNVTTQHLTIA